MVFESVVAEASFWKRLTESIKELVSESNFHCNQAGMSIQAMDSAHVALVHLALHKDGFSKFNCHRSMVMGVNLNNLSKILKAIEGNDKLTFRTEEDGDIMTISSQNEKNTRSSEFQLKLMEIEAEAMQLPDMEYRCKISMNAQDFAKVCKDMAIFGDTVTVAVARSGVTFSATSDFAEGSSTFRVSNWADQQVKTEKSAAVKAEVKTEVKTEVKAEPVADNKVAPAAKAESVKDEGGVKPEPVDADAEVAPAASEVQPDVKSEEAPVVKKEVGAEEPASPAGGLKEAKTTKKGAKETNKASEADSVAIHSLDEDVALSFALRYFTVFSKACALTERVNLHLANDSPCMVEFPLAELGSLRYYLAPKVDAAE